MSTRDRGVKSDGMLGDNTSYLKLARDLSSSSRSAGASQWTSQSGISHRLQRLNAPSVNHRIHIPHSPAIV